MYTCLPVVLLMFTIESTTILVCWASLLITWLSGTWARLVRVFDFLAVIWRISPPNRHTSTTKALFYEFIGAAQWYTVMHMLWHPLEELLSCSYHLNGTLKYIKYVQIQTYNECPLAQCLLVCRSCFWCLLSSLLPYASIGPVCTSLGFLEREHDWCGFSSFWR